MDDITDRVSERETSAPGALIEADAAERGVSGGTTTEAQLRSITSRRVLLIASAALLAVVAAYLLWPKTKPKMTVAETHTAVGAKDAATDGETHSEEGAIEVSEETAELMGIRTAQVVNGEIADNLQLTRSLRSTHEVSDRHHDVATASFLEVWIDETERRTWFLSEVLREL